MHLEEDTARLTHVTAADGAPASLIDVNRSGAPLMEIVSEPDIQTPAEAMAYGEKLRALLRWIGVSTANMEDGALRIDANISVWPEGEPIGDVKVEVKNMNSFRALGRALAFEIERQTERRRRGESIEQETRGWDETSGTTRSQRTKEYAHDYRYFPEPDLPPLRIARHRVDDLRDGLPRMPDQVAADLIDQGAPAADVAELVQDRALTDYTLTVMEAGVPASDAVTWIVHELRRALNTQTNKSAAIPIPPTEIAALLALRAQGAVSSTHGRRSPGRNVRHRPIRPSHRAGPRPPDQRPGRTPRHRPPGHRRESPGRPGLPRRQGPRPPVPHGPSHAHHPRQSQPPRRQRPHPHRTRRPITAASPRRGA